MTKGSVVAKMAHTVPLIGQCNDKNGSYRFFAWFVHVSKRVGLSRGGRALDEP